MPHFVIKFTLENQSQKSMKSMRSIFVLLTCTCLLSCGGGGSVDDGTTALRVLPSTVTVTGGAIPVCAVGQGPEVFVFGGVPPYSIRNSVPTYVSLDKTVVGQSGEGAKLTFTGGCLDNALIIFVDKRGLEVAVTVSNRPISQ
jgi:hypothetical protein